MFSFESLWLHDCNAIILLKSSFNDTSIFGYRKLVITALQSEETFLTHTFRSSQMRNFEKMSLFELEVKKITLLFGSD